MPSILELIERHSEPVPECGCWLWTASVGPKDYPRAGINGKTSIVSRAVYEYYNGEFDKTLHILHKCDTPRCINPEHLYLGTNLDNIKDKVRKGRTLKGEKNKASKLTDREALSIFNDLREAKVIAKEYGVHVDTITFIKKKKTWKHIHEGKL